VLQNSGVSENKGTSFRNFVRNAIQKNILRRHVYLRKCYQLSSAGDRCHRRLCTLYNTIGAMLSVARVCSRQLRLVIDSHTAIDFFAVFVKFVFLHFWFVFIFPRLRFIFPCQALCHWWCGVQHAHTSVDCAIVLSNHFDFFRIFVFSSYFVHSYSGFYIAFY